MAEGKCSEIFLNEVPGGVLDSMIKFMYGACKSIPDHMAVDLFVAADKFQVGFSAFINASEHIL